jgi:hypothetical protein
MLNGCVCCTGKRLPSRCADLLLLRVLARHGKRLQCGTAKLLSAPSWPPEPQNFWSLQCAAT